MEIVIASRNLGKIREFREIFHTVLGLDIDSLLGYPEYKSPSENEQTFEENAKIKALDAAKKLGKIVLADDSGLIVPILGGDPGIRSRRYAGENATDRENRQKLLSALKGKDGIERGAYFECSLALANPEGILKVVTGRCEGYISPEERGRYGFGYDPIFVKHDYDKTFGELAEDVKNRISHRRKAVDAIIPFIEHMIHESQLKKS